MDFTLKKRLSQDQYLDGIKNGDKIILSQAITLAESALTSDRKMADELIAKLLPETGNSMRIGITGIPGVGKSTFIETLGKHITAEGFKLAVLAVDPTSKKTKGSILGDKTRMESLANNPDAFIRPSPTKESLGGVSSNTRETMLLCEAAGYNVIFIETVGVGQSEVMVKEMVDFFLLLMLAGAGDELQGIKKGIMEMADAVVITKADGDNIKRTQQAQSQFQTALHLFAPSSPGWTTKVLTCSSLNGEGLTEIWELIGEYQQTMKKIGYFEENRKLQKVNWLHHEIKSRLENNFYNHPLTSMNLASIEKKVISGEISATQAAKKLLSAINNEK